MAVRRIGNVVTLSVRSGSVWGVSIGSSSYTTIITVPQGYRPAVLCYDGGSTLDAASTKGVEALINGNGEVRARNFNGTSIYYAFTFTYVTADPWPE